MQTLLAEYNGNRKTFCCVATNRLPLAQIEKIVEQVANHPALDTLPMKDKVAYVVRHFENDASREGFMLTLRKKGRLADLILFSSLLGRKKPRSHRFDPNYVEKELAGDPLLTVNLLQKCGYLAISHLPEIGIIRSHCSQVSAFDLQ